MGISSEPKYLAKNILQLKVVKIRISIQYLTFGRYLNKDYTFILLGKYWLNSVFNN